MKKIMADIAEKLHGRPIYYISAAAIGFLVLLVNQVVLPLREKNEELHAQLEIVGKRLTYLQTYAENEEKYRAAADARQLRLKNLRNRFVTKAGIDAKLGEYYTLAASRGIHIVKGQNLGSRKITENKLSLYFVQLELIGDYHDVIEFFAELERQGTQVIAFFVRGDQANGKINVKTKLCLRGSEEMK